MANIIYPFSINTAVAGDGIYGSLEVDGDLIFDYKKYCNLSYINKLLKNNTIYPRFRIFMCNPDDSYAYQIPSRDIVSGGSYSENYQNGQRRSLSFTLLNNDGKYTPGVNSIWANTKIALEAGLKIPDFDGVLWFKKGIFIVTKVSPSRSSDNATVNVECGDKFSIFESKRGTLTETTEIPEGISIQDIINDILGTDAGDGYVFDSRPIVYSPAFKGRITPTKLVGSSGSTWGEILMQLCEMLSAEMFYNAEGRLVFVPLVETIDDSSKPVIYDFVDKNGDFQNENFSFDMGSFINKIVVVGASINSRLVTAEAINDDPSSPICFQKIGYRIASPINDTNITTDTLAQERADYELRKAILATASLNSDTFFNPSLSVNNLITYTDSFFSLKRERLLLQSLSFSLDYSGLMSITACNIKNLPFVN